MPFDTELAIAAMPQANGQHPEELLRDKYPELAFLFDAMAGLRDLVEGHDDELSSAHDAGYDEGHIDGVSEATE
jgi:hypothetical protein